MRTCIVCGCTDLMACHGGCAWSKKIGRDKGLCSSCPPRATKLTRAQLIERVELKGLVETLNTKRRESAREYMRLDRRYFHAVTRLRTFEARVKRSQR